MSNPPVRVGLLLDSNTVPVWVEALLTELIEKPYATVALRVYDKGPARETPSPDYNFIDRFTLRIAEKLHQTFAEAPSRVADAFEPKDISELLADIPQLAVPTVKTDRVDVLPDEDIETIRSYDLDLIIRIGFGILENPILHVPKHGVWALHHGDERRNRGGPAAFWETMQSWDTVGSVLQRLTHGKNNRLVLSRSHAPVDRFSIAQTKNNLFWKSQAMMSREIERLHLLGAEKFFSPKRLPEQSELQFYSQRLYEFPHPREYFWLTVNKIWEKIRFITHNKRCVEQWILLYHLSDDPQTSTRQYKQLIPPLDRFWADPFAIERDGKYYIFVEEYPYNTEKGHISVIEMDDQGNISDSEPVLITDSHMSYPFLLEHEGELYMIPESVATNSVKLYRCVEFPNKWEFVQDIMSDVNLVDATLFFKDGLWWLFGNQSYGNRVNRWDECYLYSTKDFRDGNWQSHPSNPISSDVRNARPAGAIIEYNGRLFRPSQNCSRYYGYGFNMSEIVTLTPDEYEEKLVSRIMPNWDDEIIGAHTYNRAGRLNIMDAIKLRRRRR